METRRPASLESGSEALARGRGWRRSGGGRRRRIDDFSAGGRRSAASDTREFRVGEGFEDAAVGVRGVLRLPKREAGFGYQGTTGRDHEVIELGAGLAADLEDVFEAGGGDEGDAGSFAFEKSVGGDGGCRG